MVFLCHQHKLHLFLSSTVHEEDGFIGPTAASNIDLNFALEEEESGTVHARINGDTHSLCLGHAQ